MRGFAGACSLITLGDGDQATGLVVTSGVSLTAEPPMVLACVNRASSSWPLLAKLGRFGWSALVPIILIVAYAPRDVSQVVLYGALGLLVLTYLFLSLRGLFIGNRFIAPNKFHFLLYLCVVETAPLLIIYKMVATQWGK